MSKAASIRDRAAATTADSRWPAVRDRDPAADGTFFSAIRTTGIYCRPSCASRPARPENVAFYATAAEAEAAGFRPCKRCEPDRAPKHVRTAATIAEACRRIERSEEAPRLAELAAEAGMSPFHFHRTFRAATGLTPKDYSAAARAAKVRDGLAAGETVARAMYDAGFNSHGPFYASASDLLGMTPAAYRAGGAGAVIRFAIGETTLGALLVARSDAGICAILLGDDAARLARDLEDRFPRAELVGGDAAFEQLVAVVAGFVEAPALGLDLPLDIRGTAFQQRVWKALKDVPPGSTVSYTELAERIGMPRAARAVARACAANPLAVAIPCHRVVRRDGEVSGYRWGVERKRALLALETNT